MKVIFYFIALSVCLNSISCSSSNLKGRKYLGSNDLRNVTFTFVNDSTCEIRQKFSCQKISNIYSDFYVVVNYREIGSIKLNSYKPEALNTLQSKKYKALVFKNIETNTRERFTNIPNYFSLCVSDSIIRSLEGRISEGRVYHFTNDTILIRKNKIYAAGMRLVEY